MVRENGKTYVVVNDYEKLRGLFGDMLREIQRIKSEGDYEAGRALVERYAVQVDPELHKEVRDRYYALSIEPYGGFVNPEFELVEKDGEIVDVEDQLSGRLRETDARLFEELFVPAQYQLTVISFTKRCALRGAHLLFFSVSSSSVPGLFAAADGEC